MEKPIIFLVFFFVLSDHLCALIDKYDFNKKKSLIKIEADDERSEKIFDLFEEDLFKYEEEMFVTGFNFNIENACFEKLGSNFLYRVQETLVEGFQCLSELSYPKISTTMHNIRGSLINTFNLLKLLKNHKVSLICSENNFNPSTLAKGSLDKYTFLSSKFFMVQHPLISLNLTSTDMIIESVKNDQNFLKNTLFHELMHNLGHDHFESIEYAYTCSTCCFSLQENREKELACKICRGDYRNHYDLRYLKDFLEYAQERGSGMEERARWEIKEYNKLNPTDPSGYILMANSYSNEFNPVGYYMGLRIKEFQRKLTGEQRIELMKTKKFHSTDEHRASALPALLIANILVEFYYYHNEGKAVLTLNKNKNFIKKSMAKIKNKNSKHKAIEEKMNQILNKLSESLKDTSLKY